MFGIPMFRKAGTTMRCDQCRLPFDISQGGVCARCRRILCEQDLHGSWLRRLRVELGGTSVCVQCRSGVTPRGDAA